MTELKEVTFGPEAIAYLRDQLSHGHTFARYLPDLPLEGGRVHSYLPPELRSEVSRDFGGSVYLATEIKMLTGVRSRIEACH